MLFAELAEIVVFGAEPFDERFRVGHADLLAEAPALRAVPTPQDPAPTSVGTRVILPASSACQGFAWRSKWGAVALKCAVTRVPGAKPNSSTERCVTRATKGKPQSMTIRTCGPLGTR